MFLTKDKIRQILQNAPAGTTPGGIIAALRAKGARLEGYDQSISGQQIDQIKAADQRSAGAYNPSFPAAIGEDSAIKTIGKTIGNLPSSALNLGKGLVKLGTDFVKSPVSAIQGISSQISQGRAANQFSGNAKDLQALDNELTQRYISSQDPAEKEQIRQQLLQVRGQVGQAPTQQGATDNAVLGLGTAAIEGASKLLPGKQETPQFDAVVNGLKERYGGLDNLQRTITNDPFGFATEILSVVQGGAALAGKTTQLNKALSATAQKSVIQPVKALGRGVAKTGSGLKATGGFATSQLTGLDRSTVKTLVEQPKANYGVDRAGVAGDIKSAIDVRLKEIADTGKGYTEIRNAEGAVNIPKGTIESVLSKYGVKIENGKIITGPESRPLSVADKAGIEKFIADYGNETALSPNGFLNTREALSKLSKYELGSGKTDVSKAIARELRYQYDQLGKAQIKGLEKLDETFSAEKTILDQAKKDFINPKTGELKDSAISKIANATGKGKDALLARMEELSPGITKKVQVLKAAEDIERANGIKVGTYVRGAVAGAGIMSGNIPAIVMAIISSPKIAVPLIKGYGLTKAQIAQVVRLLKSTQVSQFISKSAGAIGTAANELNDFKIPTKVKEFTQNPKMGLALEDVSKSASKLDPLAAEARKYKSAEEFVSKLESDTPIFKENGKNLNKVYRGSNFNYDSTLVKVEGTPFTINPETANYWAKSKMGGKVEEFYITPDAKIYKPKLPDRALTESEKRGFAYEAWDKGFDAVDLTKKGEQEFRVINPEIVKTKSQLTDLWNKANKGN